MEQPDFNHEVVTALHHLYEPLTLRKSRLFALLQIEQNAEAVPALRRTLISAIHSLKPGSKTPYDSSEHRYYLILVGRFVEQRSQKEVSADLAVSERHLRRLESEAITALCDSLRLKYAVEAGAESASTVSTMHETDVEMSGPSELDTQHLRTQFQTEEINLTAVIAEALETAMPLFDLLDVQPDSPLETDPVWVVGQSSVLAQALLNLLIASAQIAPAGTVQIRINAGLRTVRLTITAVKGRDDGGMATNEAAESIEITRHLIAASGAMLEVDSGSASSPPTAWTLQMTLRNAARIRVLAVEDNQDVVKLLERYVTGSQFDLLGVSDLSTLFTQISAYKPHLIMLDVMMSDTNGWEILGQLRAHPLTSHIPVIVCSILPQEPLAYALGAADYLRKPVTRELLLKMLNHQLDELEKAP